MKPKPLEEAERQAQYMAREIGKKLPDGWGFVLLLGSLGEAGNHTYVSSVQRESAGKWLKEAGESIMDHGSPHRLNPLSDELDEATRWLLQGLVHACWLAEGPEAKLDIDLLRELLRKCRGTLEKRYPELCQDFL